MSSHNLSVALASQIGVEVLLCTKSYDALATSWNGISASYSGLLASYQKQLILIEALTGSNTELQQCLTNYRQQITKTMQDILSQFSFIEKMVAISSSRQRTYASKPLQCPIGIDLYTDIVSLRGYESDLQSQVIRNSLMESALTT